MIGKHTPGPWTVDTQWTHGNAGFVHAGEGSPRAGARVAIVTGMGGPTGPWWDEAEANARLIAAAPDLLAACEAALAWHECETESDHCWSMVRVALDQARGEDGA